MLFFKRYTKHIKGMHCRNIISLTSSNAKALPHLDTASVVIVICLIKSIIYTKITWNFRSREGKWHETFAPLCPKIVLATNCTHGEPGSQDVIPCTRPVEACRPKRLMRQPPHMLQDINTCISALSIPSLTTYL